jgi:glycosyltransferase involved in cell wall biosynthesis
MAKKKILFLTDWPEQVNNTEALQALLDEYHSDEYEWHVWSCTRKQDSSLKYRWTCYFRGALYAIRNSKKYDGVFIWQQMIGFILFEMKRFFPFIKLPKNIIVYTFIYNGRKRQLKSIRKHIVAQALRYSKKLIWNSSQMANKVKNDFPKYRLKNSYATTPMFEIINTSNRLDESIDDPLLRNGVFSGGSSERDFNIVVRAFRNTSIPVTIVCPCDYVFTEPITPNIRILRNVSHCQFYALINQAFCVVVSLKSEDSPNGQLVATYAMAHSKPVIASDCYGVRDLISDKKNGLLFTVGNSEELLAAYRKLKRNSVLRKKMVTDASKIAEENDPNRFIPKLISIFETEEQV